MPINEIPSQNQSSLYARDLQSVWHPFTPLPDNTKVLPLSGAKGVYLHTTDGRKILDAISSWWVNLHGHSHEHIARAIYEQASTLEHVIFAGFTHEPAVRLAERLLAILPANQDKVFYSDNGSTAVEVALKMAFQYWHNQGITKRKVIAMDGSYHGDTFGAMSVGDRNVFITPFVPYLFNVEFIPFPQNIYSSGYVMNHASTGGSTIELFLRLAQTGEIAAFIYEPIVQGAAGMRMYAPEVLDQLLSIAREHQILCIADEVMTGFGRTGKLFASQYCTVQPDIMCLSKGLTGGTMALGVTTCTEEVMRPYRSDDLMKTFFHGHSFTANPIACAAANASLDLLLRDECQENIRRVTEKHLAFLHEIAHHPRVLDARAIGTILAIEVKTSADTSYFNEVRNSLYDFFMARNILLRPLGNIVYVLPPYVITNEELDIIYQAIMELLNRE
jgi:adenosylmethionine---8-amino-7-oxononanoate aminotransferase